MIHYAVLFFCATCIYFVLWLLSIKPTTPGKQLFHAVFCAFSFGICTLAIVLASIEIFIMRTSS